MTFQPKIQYRFDYKTMDEKIKNFLELTPPERIVPMLEAIEFAMQVYELGMNQNAQSIILNYSKP